MSLTLLRVSLLSLSCLASIRATPPSTSSTDNLDTGQSLVYPRDDGAEILEDSLFPGGSCKRINTCVSTENPQVMSCEKNGYEGHRTVGWDRAGCGKDYGKPICCPHDTGVTSCTWRSGKGGDCNAQCNAGEVALVGSSWGGGWDIDGNTNKCNRGYKAFCCEVPEFEQLSEGCKMSDCGKPCPDGFDSLFETKCSLISRSSYCCPSDTNVFKDCLIRGGASGRDCANPLCHANEVSIDKYTYDKNGNSCAWGRKKSACCALNEALSPGPSESPAPIDAPPPPAPTGSSETAQCSDVNTCDEPGWCSDDYGDLPAEAAAKRDLTDVEAGHSADIEKRGRAGPKFTIRDLLTNIEVLVISARNIRTTPAGELFQTQRGILVPQERYETQSSDCGNLTVGATPIQLSDKGKYRQIDGQIMAGTEHVVDQSYFRRFIENARLGRLLTQGPSRVPAIPDSYWRGIWQRAVLPDNLPPIGDQGISPQIPYERVLQALGTRQNRGNLLLTSGNINGPKGAAFDGDPPISADSLRERVITARDSGQGESLFLEFIRQGMAIVSYMNLPQVSERVINVHRLFQQQLEYISEFTQNEEGGDRLVPYNRDFRMAYYIATQELLQEWAAEMIRTARQEFNDRPMGANYAAVMETLEQLEQQIESLIFNFLDELD